MDSLGLQVLHKARAWHAENHPVWLVTVIETWGAAPRPPGALLAIRSNGLVDGSVSGGCVEDGLIERARHGERVDKPSLITYGVSKAGTARFGLPCGGNLRLVQEPLVDPAWIDEVLRRTARHGLFARRLEVRTGMVTIEPAHRGEVFQFDGHVVRALFGPRWRLVIIGAGQLSRAVARIALMSDLEVICCDPREEFYLTWDIPDGARKRRLAMFNLSPDEIRRLHGPIALDIGCRTPAEIAVSILAEVIAVRNGVALSQNKLGRRCLRSDQYRSSRAPWTMH